MALFDRLKSPLQAIVVASWLLTSGISASSPALADSPSDTSHRAEFPSIRFIQANASPPRRGTPPTREGTGSRGSCLHKPDHPPLTRLVGGERLNLSVSDRPTVWVYVPYTATDAPTGEFSLQQGDEELYRTQFSLPEQPGVIGITLPKMVKSLQTGKAYRWYVDINCSATARGNISASITGMVQRVKVSDALQQELQTAQTPLERVASYARHGIWYETLTELANLRLQEPNNAAVRAAWINLLSDQDIGLGTVANGTIVTTIPLQNR